jgi:thiosulfate/3-mercaptopyruvate sulfurtransferase
MAKTISTGELADKLGDPSLVVVDLRPLAAYNGWRLKGEARGGHIQGAVACPLAWTDNMDPADLKKLLSSKGITQDKSVVLYSYTAEDTLAMVDMLADFGYQNVRAYADGVEAWAADEALPMEHLARYEKLVHPEWLDRLISGQQPESYGGNGYAVFHVNFGVPEEYEVEHLPGAMYLDTNALESAVDWNRRSAKELEAALLARGITHDMTVVVYGRHSRPTMKMDHPGQKAGQIAATRAAAILMYAGVEDVRLLDGGFDGWVAAGYGVDTENHQPVPAESFGVGIPAHPEYIVDIDVARGLIAEPDGELVSIRSWPEFVGEVSGYHYIEPKGRIAGAVWGNCGTDAYHMQHYRNADNTMRAYNEIAANWLEAGLTADKHLAFYCGTGWRASETFFYAYLMGFPHVAVYDGGWYEWSADPANPIETGDPETA